MHVFNKKEIHLLKVNVYHCNVQIYADASQ